jgi:hypothetical protein
MLILNTPRQRSHLCCVRADSSDMTRDFSWIGRIVAAICPLFVSFLGDCGFDVLLFFSALMHALFGAPTK